MRVWWLWLIVAGGSLVMLLGVRAKPMAAGANWFGRTRHSWVKTYELASVRVVKAWAADNLELKDAAGRSLSVKLSDIQRNLHLWDLVYNGIPHSVCSGRARTNQIAREKLRLSGVFPVEDERGQPSGGALAPTHTMSKASRVVHTVLGCVFVVLGIFALAVAFIGVTSGDAFESSDGIIGVVILGIIGAGFIGLFVWLWRRIER